MGDQTVQVPFRMDKDARDRFKAMCAQRHTTQQNALEKLVEAYTVNAERGDVFHLDGTKCPISAMLDTMAQIVGAEARLRMQR